jgi:hypothetical protein
MGLPPAEPVGVGLSPISDLLSGFFVRLSRNRLQRPGREQLVHEGRRDSKVAVENDFLPSPKGPCQLGSYADRTRPRADEIPARREFA